jgi:hypothetical protein
MIQDDIFIALIAALVNLILSILVPCAMKDKANFLPTVRTMLQQHRTALITSSVLVAVTVFLALQAAPVVKNDILPDYIVNLAKLSR